MFIATQLSEEEMIELVLNTFTDRAMYLQSLDVNSEGSYINKGEPITITDDSSQIKNTIVEAFRQTHASVVHFNYKEYCQYNENFLRRTRVNGVLNKCVYCLSALAILCALIGARLLSFLILILIIFCLAINRLFIDLGDTPIKLFEILGFKSVL